MRGGGDIHTGDRNVGIEGEAEGERKLLSHTQKHTNVFQAQVSITAELLFMSWWDLVQPYQEFGIWETKMK